MQPKSGETMKYEVGGKTLVLEPITYGRLKKLLALMANVWDEAMKAAAGDTVAFVRKCTDLVQENMGAIFPLLFDPTKHDFMNEAWLDNNLTIPLAKQIVEDAIKVNELEDFFRQRGLLGKGEPAAPAREVRSLTERTPSEAAGPTTSSERHTDGAPKT